MKIFGSNVKEKAANLSAKDPRQIIGDLMKHASGESRGRELRFNLFYRFIAFRGVVEGVGCSTLVSNVALALSKLDLSVCVIDTSMLTPVQDYLLDTSSLDNKKDDKDWMDLPFTKESVLHISKKTKKVSVLSFHAGHRGVVDALSQSDSENLVERAFEELEKNFDIILIDSCSELTKINTACLQKAHKVIQLWNDTPHIVANISNFIDNSATLACPLDKMRFVVYSKCSRNVIGNMDEILEKYRLQKLGTTYASEEMTRALVQGLVLYQCASEDADIIAYTECVIAIITHICALDTKLAQGTISSNEIMDGTVKGTLHNVMLEESVENGVTIVAPDKLDPNVPMWKEVEENKESVYVPQPKQEQQSTPDPKPIRPLNNAPRPTSTAPTPVRPLPTKPVRKITPKGGAN